MYRTMTWSRDILVVTFLILNTATRTWGDCVDKGVYREETNGKHYFCSDMTREQYNIKIVSIINSRTVRGLNLVRLNLTIIDPQLFSHQNYLNVYNLTIQQCGVIAIENNSFDIFTKLDYLHILDNNIKYLNSQFINSKLGYLVLLDLCHNNIQQFTINCNHHLKLKKIKINNNYLTTLRENSFKNCEETLTEVQISNSSIKEIQKDAFIGLNSSANLDLTNNPIERVEAGAFSGLTGISKINFTNFFGNIKGLKRGMFLGFKSIKRINLSYLNIQSLEGRTFQGLLSLEFLDLDNNNISILRAYTFSDLPRLEFLSLENNPIIQVEPHAFVNMPDYRIIDFHQISRHMKHIQEGFFDGIHNVTVLNLTALNIYTIEPEAFEDIHFLESLYLNHNNLEVLSSNQFSQFHKLQFLTLTHNPIEYINPTAFFNLTNLRLLNISSTNLSFLENGTFDSLISLNILDLSLCKFKKLEIKIFCKSELYLNNNQIEYISVRAFQNLTSLNRLYLQFNKISQLETGVFTALGQLRYLDMSHNKLSALSEPVLHPLKSLRQIDLSGNQWACQHLTLIRKYFQLHGIAYHSKTHNLNVNNIGGIECIDDQITEVPEPNTSGVEPILNDIKNGSDVNIVTKINNRNELNKTAILLNNRIDSNKIVSEFSNTTLSSINMLDTMTAVDEKLQKIYDMNIYTFYIIFIFIIGYLCLKILCFIYKFCIKRCLRKRPLQVGQNTLTEMILLNRS